MTERNSIRMIYFLILLYTIILIRKYEIPSIKTSKGRDVHRCILLIIVVSLSGFSYRIGIDSIRYENIFDSLPALNEVGDIESLLIGFVVSDPLWVILNSSCKIFVGEFWFVKLVTAAFVNITIFWFVNKHTQYFFQTIFLYFLLQFWNFNFEILRESISVSFFLLALDNIIGEKKNYFRYYLLATPSIFFHSFGFITFFLPLIQLLDIKKHLKILIIITIIVTPFLMYFSDYLTGLGFLGDEAQRKMEEKYTDTGNQYGSGTINFFGMIIRMVTIISGIYIIKHVQGKVNKYIVPYGLFYILVAIMCFGFAILYRIDNYLSIPLFICIAPFISECFQRLKDGKIIILFVFLLSIMEPVFHQDYYIKYIPYSSIFNKQEYPPREKIFNNS